MPKPSDNPMTIGIIGGGVAGMSCALWLKHLACRPVIIEQNDRLGGQLQHLDRINRWVLGFPNKTSAELAGIYADHINQEAIEVLYQAHLLAVTRTATGFDAAISQNGHTYPLTLQALVIATGARILGPEAFTGLPGFAAIHAAGLASFFPTAHLPILPALQGKTVAVIGGGDNAHYTAKDLALAGAKTYLLMRSSPKARPAIRKDVVALAAQGLVTERTGSEVLAFRQHQNGIEISLSNGDVIDADRVFARLGFTANSEFLTAFPALAGLSKHNSYITVDAYKRTSIAGVYAIGDVANSKHQSVANAIAEGAVAAQDLSGWVWKNDNSKP